MRQWLHRGLGSLSKLRAYWYGRSRMAAVKGVLCVSAKAVFILFPCGTSCWLGRSGGMLIIPHRLD
jgi:hypothetical protein